jgi:hypothetical protein
MSAYNLAIIFGPIFLRSALPEGPLWRLFAHRNCAAGSSVGDNVAEALNPIALRTVPAIVYIALLLIEDYEAIFAD